MVDLTPRALLHRLERGVVYSREKAQHALENFFRESSLAALRELTMREAAHEVDHRIGANDTQTQSTQRGLNEQGKRHRILVLVTADPKPAMVIRRARRVSDFLGAECFAVAVRAPGDRGSPSEGVWESIEKHLNFASNLRIETRILEGGDVASAVIDFARTNEVTQIFSARPHATAWGPAFSRDPVHRIIDRAKDMQIVIVSDREKPTL